jgi:hypothetical protein
MGETPGNSALFARDQTNEFSVQYPIALISGGGNRLEVA